MLWYILYNKGLEKELRPSLRCAAGDGWACTSSIVSGKLNVVMLDSNYSVKKVLGTNKNESILLNFTETDEYIVRANGMKNVKVM